jgi:HEPN domain-containing protein
MLALTREWVEKAEADFLTAQREYRARKAPNYDAVCFHSQQCVEKYLKALLQEHNIAFGKIHDLAVLLNLLLVVHPAWSVYLPAMRSLSAYAVEFRYPGFTADRALAKSALFIMR